MASRTRIREILGLIPQDRLDSHLRAEIARLLGTEDAAGLDSVARRALEQLLRSGDLVPVAIDGQSRRRGKLLLVRGSNRLIDSSGLLRSGRRTSSPRTESRPLAPAVSDVPASATESDREESDDLGDVLDAMELAQDLSVGDPRADEPALTIERILGLLQRFVPQVRLHAQLTEPLEEPDQATHLLVPDTDGPTPFWLQHRRPGQSLWIPSTAELPPALRQRLADEMVTAVVPLISPAGDEGEVGMLFVSAESGTDSDELLELAGRLSGFVSRRWRCQRDVNRRVLTDSLTGVHNRAFYDSQFPLELERVRRNGQALTLVIGDLDHFKTINDTHGHPCGDHVLRSVARQLLRVLRRIDIVCRIGGEEFAIILPSTSLDEAREVLLRLAGRPFHFALPPDLGVGNLEVSMSYGVVSFPDAGTTASELHRKADSLLYRAKELGRNRCCIWTLHGPRELPSPTPPA